MTNWQPDPTRRTPARTLRHVGVASALIGLVALGVLLARSGAPTPWGERGPSGLTVDEADAGPTEVPPQRPPRQVGEWEELPDAPLTGRSGHLAVWTGVEMLVWGGRDDAGEPLDDGARYRPTTAEWETLPVPPAGQVDEPVEGVWTGREVVVLGTAVPMTYRPGERAWTTAPPPPPGRWAWTAAAWTGREVVVLALGEERGAAYDPQENAWRELPAPPLEGVPHAVSSELRGRIVMVGESGGLPALAVYDPRADAWEGPEPAPVEASSGGWAADLTVDRRRGRVLLAGPVEGSDEHAAWSWSPERGWNELLAFPKPMTRAPPHLVWTDSGLLAWVGDSPDNTQIQPASSATQWLNIAKAPLRARHGASAVWTEGQLLVWGGSGEGETLADGAALTAPLIPGRPPGQSVPAARPVENPDFAGNWVELPDQPLVPARSGALWTGEELLLFHALEPTEIAAYDPGSETWRLGEPRRTAPERSRYGVTWTGEELVLLGSTIDVSPGTLTATAYHPGEDRWRELPDPPRANLGPVQLGWTGEELVVLTGSGGTTHSFVYRPGETSWRELSVPDREGTPTAVTWTGSELVAIWSGRERNVARWEPGDDAWRATTDSPAGPLPGRGVAWDGGELLVAGSRAAAYNPDSDVWRDLPDPPFVPAVPTGSPDHPLLTGPPSRSYMYDRDAEDWRSLPPIATGGTGRVVPVWTDEELIVATRDGAFLLRLAE